MTTSKPCLCFPGQCRGQVVDGKQPNGDICKADYAKSDEAWFYWDASMLPTSPALAGGMLMEWELVSGHKAKGEARAPSWYAGPHRVGRYRWTDPRVMLLNPYTGQRRDAVDIMQDPEGKGVVAPTKPWDAAVAASVTVEGQRVLSEMLTLNIGAMVNRFLGWKLPEGFDPDCGISFDRKYASVASWPIGTNLLNADQAREMLEYVIDGAFPAQRERNETFSDELTEAHAAIKTLEALGYLWHGGEQWAPPLGKKPAYTAPELLDAAAGHMRDRAKTYDKPEGERSMGATVQAFNAITGRDLRESEGWLLMSLLKMVRSESKDEPHRDSIEDLAAYAGLYGEARLGGL